jgi:hypothetical protein
MTTESEMKQLGRQLREYTDQANPNTTPQPTTKTCQQCQTEIDRKACVCPHCRSKQPGSGLGRAFVVLCALGLMIVVGGANSGGSSSSSTKPVQIEVQTTKPVEQYTGNEWAEDDRRTDKACFDAAPKDEKGIINLVDYATCVQRGRSLNLRTEFERRRVLEGH